MLSFSLTCFFPTEITTVCCLKYGAPNPPERLQKSSSIDTVLCKFAIWELQALTETTNSLLSLSLDEGRQMSLTGPGDSWKHQLGIKDLTSPPTTGTPGHPSLGSSSMCPAHLGVGFHPVLKSRRHFPSPTGTY